jgi:penicillin amidase
MRIVLLILKRLLLAFVILALIAFAAMWLTLRASRAQLSGDYAALTADLRAPVKIERDALGVATLHAASRNDASYALGFVHAQERYFAMDLMRRLAAGELAELVGAAALPLDKPHRALRLRARAQDTLATAPQEQLADLTAYRNGVNAGLAALGSRPWEYWLLGSQPQPWSEADSILVVDAMFLDLNDSTNARELAFSRMKAALPASVFAFLRSAGGPWDAPLLGPAMKAPALPPGGDIDLSKLDPKLLKLANSSPLAQPGERLGALSLLAANAPLTPALSPDDEAVGGEGEVVGSNNLAVGGSLTATHAAMVAGDMHLGLRVPNIWFRARLQYPNPRRAGESVDLIGVTLPGLPALVAGSNRHVAWAFTNSYGDWLDWVRVNLDPQDKSRYRTADGWQALKQTTEVIKVHNAADVKLDLRDTQWGPIIADDADGTPLALAWTALREGATNMELLHLDVAETVDEAIETANRAGMPVQNFVVGDRAGNVGWTLAGHIPRRTGDYDPQLPADWSQPGIGWNGWLDPSEYPRLPNPASARLWTANGRTLDFESKDYATVGDGGVDLGARAMQIRDDLKAKDQFTPADFLAIQLDDRALLLNHWHDLLRETVAHADGANLAELKKYTDDWNGRADPASVGYRLTRTFRLEVIDTVLDGFAAAVRQKFPDFKMPQIQQAEHLVSTLIAQRPAHLLPPGYKDWNDLLLHCAQRVAAKASERAGGIASYRWGEYNTTRIRHPLSSALPFVARWLDMPADELPGDNNMPRVQGPTFGASQRFGVQPGHEETGYFHMPGGQSGNPLSPFYGAGHEDWAQGKPTPFLPGDTKYTLQLTPKS